MNKPTIKEVEEWVMTLYNTCEETITDAERREQHKYATMVQRPQDKKFLVKMLDESSQIRDDKKLAKRIKVLIDEYGIPKFLNKRDTFLFKVYQSFGHYFYPIAIPIIKKRLRIRESFFWRMRYQIHTQLEQDIQQRIYRLFPEWKD